MKTLLIADAPGALPAIVAALQPIHDRVLVKIVEEEVALDQILIVKDHAECVDAIDGMRDPEGKHNDYRRVGILGEIIAVGPGKWVKPERGEEFFRPTTVKPGEFVYFTNWNDWEEAPPGFALITEGDVMGHALKNRMLTLQGPNQFACRKKRTTRR